MIPLDERGQLQEAFNVRLEELRVVDLAMLEPATPGGPPTLGVLFEDTKEQRHAKTYTLALRDKVRACVFFRRGACWLPRRGVGG